MSAQPLKRSFGATGFYTPPDERDPSHRLIFATISGSFETLEIPDDQPMLEQIIANGGAAIIYCANGTDKKGQPIWDIEVRHLEN